MSDQVIIKGKVKAKELQQAPVKPTIIIGIGGSGGDVLLRIRKRFFEKYGSLSQFPIVAYLWIDTDATEKDVGAGVFAEHIAFGSAEKIMATMNDTTRVTNDLNQYPHIKRWFYPGLNKKGTMTEGAGQIRAYSRLGFYEHYTEIRNAIVNAGAQVTNVENIKLVRNEHQVDANPNDLQVFMVFSLAGGTGSGMFLDLGFLVKEIFLSKALTTVGYILMPGLFNPHEDRVFANGYAALKELEHYSYEHSFEVAWPDKEHTITCPPFKYAYLIDRTNHSNNSVDFATRHFVFNMVADNIFKDFSKSDFAGYKRGVRDNLDQHLADLFAFQHLSANGEKIIDQKFVTRFSSFGMTSITVPADQVELACAYKLAADVVDHWGSLSHTDFNAAVLTDTVLNEVLPAIKIYEGNFSSQGVIEQRRDIQNSLLDDGRKQGQKIHNLINQSIGETAREARDGIHAQKGQTLAQYLRAAVEREQAKLDNRKADPQQWGDYSRAVHFNKQEIGANAEKLLHQEMGRIINEQHQSVGYAIALLNQVVNILRDEHREYIPNLERAREQDIKRAEEGRKRLDHLLAEIARHESRSNLDGRKKTILSYDIQRFEVAAPSYLNSVLVTQVRGAAKEICERLISYIGGAERTDGAEMPMEGLVGELYTLGGQLEKLREGLDEKYRHFRKPAASDLSMMLYKETDIEENYVPRYLGTGEKARVQIESIGDQILRELQTSVIDLPKVVRQQGIDQVELRIRDLARTPFKNIKNDFDVIESLWKQYPSESEREREMRFIYEKAKFWLQGGGRPRSYQLEPERHKILVGIPQNSNDQSKLDNLKDLLKRIRLPGDPALSIQPLSDSSEIVFYSEVGGIPINWADSIAEMRQKYFKKQADGEELHTDCHEIKFADLLVLDDRERQELEEAHECFLLGLIFGEIKPEEDAHGRVRYQWSEEIGLTGKERTISLGIEMRALAELISKTATRRTLMERVREHVDRVRRDRDSMARFNALLAWYDQEIFKPGKIEGQDGVVHIEQSNACRAVAKQIDQIKASLEALERSQPGSKREFRELSLHYGDKLDEFAPKLVDGKRAFVPDTVESESNVVRMSGR